MPPSRKREITGNDAGTGTKFSLEFVSEPAHDVREKITENHVGISDIHIPEILESHLNPFQPDCAEARQHISERVYLKPQRPDTIAPLRSPENPPVPASDIDEKVTRVHRYMIEECPDLDLGRGVKHGSLRNREHGDKGKGEEKFADDENPHGSKKYYNPGWHIFSLYHGSTVRDIPID
jgi:hypothetical protein